MAKRRVLSLRYRFCWRLEGNAGVMYQFVGFTKKVAIAWARVMCRDLWSDGELVQLRVFNKNGRIAFEATYGKDSPRWKG